MPPSGDGSRSRRPPSPDSSDAGWSPPGSAPSSAPSTAPTTPAPTPTPTPPPMLTPAPPSPPPAEVPGPALAATAEEAAAIDALASVRASVARFLPGSARMRRHALRVVAHNQVAEMHGFFGPAGPSHPLGPLSPLNPVNLADPDNPLNPDNLLPRAPPPSPRISNHHGRPYHPVQVRRRRGRGGRCGAEDSNSGSGGEDDTVANNDYNNEHRRVRRRVRRRTLSPDSSLSIHIRYGRDSNRRAPPPPFTQPERSPERVLVHPPARLPLPLPAPFMWRPAAAPAGPSPSPSSTSTSTSRPLPMRPSRRNMPSGPLGMFARTAPPRRVPQQARQVQPAQPQARPQPQPQTQNTGDESADESVDDEPTQSTPPVPGRPANGQQ